ncbi:MAG: hypothetical protein RL885_30630 [Planctomycetota bacterium]
MGRLWGLASLLLLGACGTFHARFNYDQEMGDEKQLQDIDLVWSTEDDDIAFQSDEDVYAWFDETTQRTSRLRRTDEGGVPLARTFLVEDDQLENKEIRLECPSGARRLYVLVRSVRQLEGRKLFQEIVPDKIPGSFTVHFDREGLKDPAIRPTR